MPDKGAWNQIQVLLKNSTNFKPWTVSPALRISDFTGTCDKDDTSKGFVEKQKGIIDVIYIDCRLGKEGTRERTVKGKIIENQKIQVPVRLQTCWRGDSKNK